MISDPAKLDTYPSGFCWLGEVVRVDPETREVTIRSPKWPTIPAVGVGIEMRDTTFFGGRVRSPYWSLVDGDDS